MKLREVTDAERQEWRAEFEAAARRTLEQRLKYAFIKTYKPVLDDAFYRSFDGRLSPLVRRESALVVGLSPCLNIALLEMFMPLSLTTASSTCF